jgi:hypothetical protein
MDYTPRQLSLSISAASRSENSPHRGAQRVIIKFSETQPFLLLLLRWEKARERDDILTEEGPRESAEHFRSAFQERARLVVACIIFRRRVSGTHA